MSGAAARVAALLLLAGAPALLVSACEAGPGDAAPDRFEVVDSAGVALVLNGQVGPWGPDPLPVREALRIGVVEGEDPYQFAQVSDVLSAGGRIFVGNELTGTVRVFDAHGTFLREFGGRGQGPGRSLLVSADGSFWVERIDHRSPAMVEFEWMFSHVLAELGLDEPTLWDLFDPEGRFLGQVELPDRFQPHQVDGTTVLGVERDDLDVEYVVRYAVQVPEGADEG